MITKTQIEIMKVLTGKIIERFSIKEVSEIIKKPYPLVHRSVKELIENNLLLKDNKKFIYLNYKENFQIISYIEALRTSQFLKNQTISLFAKDVLNKINSYFFIFLVFGSSVESKNFKDIDILIITENKEKIDETEKIISNISSNFLKKFDINVISSESAYEMLNKRDSINILNETLNKHILIYGAENYYRILKNARR